MTGASGFVGRHLVKRLRQDPTCRVLMVQRRPLFDKALDIDRHVLDIGPDTDWSALLDGVDALVHLAARAHILKETEADELAAFRRDNVESTFNLARQAGRHGVRRFVFLSSIGVHGAETIKPFSIEDVPHPHSNYAVTKLEAEHVLVQAAQSTPMETVILRAPLIYGPDAPGNFTRLVRLVRTGMPLPFGSLKNRRSLLSVDNLADLLALCIDHPAAADRTFLAADAEPISTPDILRQIAVGLSRRAVLLPFPLPLLNALMALMGKDSQRIQLCGSLEVDTIHTRQTLGWTPCVATPQGIVEAVAAYSI